MALPVLVLEYIKVLVWPVVVMIGVAVFREPILAMIGRVRGATLPGGVSFDFAEELKEAESLSKEVRRIPEPKQAKGVRTIPLTEANQRMIDHGLQPSPSGLNFDYYRGLALSDPSLALAGLRMEIEVLARNLAKGFKVDVREHDSASALLRRLQENGAITADQFALAQRVVRLCNVAVHGRRVSLEEAEEVLDIAGVLRDQYVSWLSWGFDDRLGGR